MTTKTNCTVYTGTFTKLNGENRTMTFVRTNELPSDVYSGPTTIDESRSGREVVYDLKAKGFRTYNWSTTISPITETNEVVEFTTSSKS